jgi:hypothetical protein
MLRQFHKQYREVMLGDIYGDGRCGRGGQSFGLGIAQLQMRKPPPRSSNHTGLCCHQKRGWRLSAPATRNK